MGLNLSSKLTSDRVRGVSENLSQFHSRSVRSITHGHGNRPVIRPVLHPR